MVRWLLGTKPASPTLYLPKSSTHPGVSLYVFYERRQELFLRKHVKYRVCIEETDVYKNGA